MKETFDKKARPRELRKGDLILMWNGRDEKPRKFDSLWLGSYKIEDVVGLNSFYLNHLAGEKLPLPINGQVLKLYYTNVKCHIARLEEKLSSREQVENIIVAFHTRVLIMLAPAFLFSPAFYELWFILYMNPAFHLE